MHRGRYKLARNMRCRNGKVAARGEDSAAASGCRTPCAVHAACHFNNPSIAPWYLWSTSKSLQKFLYAFRLDRQPYQYASNSLEEVPVCTSNPLETFPLLKPPARRNSLRRSCLSTACSSKQPRSFCLPIRIGEVPARLSRPRSSCTPQSRSSVNHQYASLFFSRSPVNDGAERTERAEPTTQPRWCRTRGPRRADHTDEPTPAEHVKEGPSRDSAADSQAVISHAGDSHPADDSDTNRAKGPLPSRRTRRTR